jgi:hypothetical protein
VTVARVRVVGSLAVLMALRVLFVIVSVPVAVHVEILVVTNTRAV